MTVHAARFTMMLMCGCFVFVRGDEPFGYAVESVLAGEQLRIGRLCPVHGRSEAIAIVNHERGGTIGLVRWP